MNIKEEINNLKREREQLLCEYSELIAEIDEMEGRCAVLHENINDIDIEIADAEEDEKNQKTLKETEELLSDDISQLNSKLKSLNDFIAKYRTVDRIVDRSVWEARVQRREIINRIFELEGVTK